jgi:PTS system nitrogen regulatory IIA component
VTELTALKPDFDIILSNIKAVTRKQVMTCIAKQTALYANIDEQIVFDLLMDRERLATSGIGGGISIPHLRLSNLRARVYGIVRLSDPVDFASLDAQPVDIVTFVFSPVEDGMKHLSRLSRLTRLMRNTEFARDIRRAENLDMMKVFMMDHQEMPVKAAA